MVNILNNPNISKFHRTNSEGHYKGVFLFGRRPDRVIEMACFDSKLQKARNTSERKQAKETSQATRMSAARCVTIQHLSSLYTSHR